MSRRPPNPESTPPRSPRGGGVYIHIPFCRSLCDYCHFARITDHDAAFRQRYLKALVAELDLYGRDCRGEILASRPVDSLYIGGGTPSLVDPEALMKMLKEILKRIDKQDDMELTIEANPESFDLALAQAWRSGGVGRVSLGVQSFDDTVLQTLGRCSTPVGAREALAIACDVFPRVSADWILAPGVDSRQLTTAFTEARRLGVGHVSLYILEIHEGTPIARRVRNGELTAMSQRRLEEAYLEAVAALSDLGYLQYEISNFALPGETSRHNAAYWRHRPYLGLGASASGYWGRTRYTNHREIADYLRDVEAGSLPIAEWDHLDAPALRLEKLFLPLRTSGGVPLRRVPLVARELEQGQREGLWRTDEDRLYLTARGYLHIDSLETLWARRLRDEAAG